MLKCSVLEILLGAIIHVLINLICPHNVTSFISRTMMVNSQKFNIRLNLFHIESVVIVIFDHKYHGIYLIKFDLFLPGKFAHKINWIFSRRNIRFPILDPRTDINKVTGIRSKQIRTSVNTPPIILSCFSSRELKPI